MAKLTILVLCWMVATGHAAFSLFPIDNRPGSLNTGEAAPPAEPRLRAMGGAGLAFADTINYTLQNPATLASLDATIIGVTYSPEVTQLLDGKSGAAYRNFSDDFPQGELVWPMGRFGTFLLGHKRYRNLNYDIRYKDDGLNPIHQFGEGGTFAGLVGYAIQVNPRLSLGLIAGKLYGKTVRGNAIEAPNGGAGAPASLIETNRYAAQLVELGALMPWGPYSLGLTLGFPVGNSRVERKNTTISHFSISDSLAPTSTSSQIADFEPLRAAIGLGWRPNRRTKWAADCSAARFSITNRLTEITLGTGVEYAFADKRSDKYYLNIPLRAGLYYRDLGYSENVKEYAATFGFTLPTARNYGLLNFSFEGGERTSNQFYFTERFVRFSVQMMHKGRWGRLRTAGRGNSPVEGE